MTENQVVVVEARFVKEMVKEIQEELVLLLNDVEHDEVTAWNALTEEQRVEVQAIYDARQRNTPQPT